MLAHKRNSAKTGRRQLQALVRLRTDNSHSDPPLHRGSRAAPPNQLVPREVEAGWTNARN